MADGLITRREALAAAVAGSAGAIYHLRSDDGGTVPGPVSGGGGGNVTGDCGHILSDEICTITGTSTFSSPWRVGGKARIEQGGKVRVT